MSIITKKYKELEEYGFDNLNIRANYTFNNIDFICTCCACPEQYDCIFDYNNKSYQVGYVRLRYGKLTCSFPDVGNKTIYEHIFEDEPYLGVFPSEEERSKHLEIISELLTDELIPHIIMLNKRIHE